MKKAKKNQTSLLRYQEIMLKFLGKTLDNNKALNDIIDKIGDKLSLNEGLKLAQALIYNYFLDEEKSNPIIAQINSHLDLKELEKGNARGENE